MVQRLRIGLLVLAAVVALTTIVGWWSRSDLTTSPDSVREPEPEPPEDSAAPVAAMEAATPLPLDAPADLFESQMALYLLETYGDRIDDVRIRAALRQIRDQVLARFPEDGASRFRRILELAFPDLAEAILALLDRLDQYDQWLEDQRLTLEAMNVLERNGALWQQRRALFGADADRLWAEEAETLARQQASMREAIRTLDETPHASLDEKLYQFQNALQENLGELQSKLVSPGLVSQVFFSMDSVQSTLKALPPAERQERINAIRRQAGIPEAQIERLQALDESRNQRWERGLAYMSERDQLAATLPEPERSEAIEALRQRVFAHEAQTIRLEEESGFFRFQRPRIYGRN